MQSTEFLERLLEKQNIPITEQEQFLNPLYEHLHNPFLFRDMESAVVRLFEAIQGNEHIVIYSDYDADGIPGGVILHDLLVKIGYTNFENYIPHRHDEGYGLHATALPEFAERETKLLITVDLGITAVLEVAQAKVFGIDVIITDHHLPPVELPRAFAIINPKRIDNTYPYTELCGAGVVFKLVQGFIQKYGEFFSIPEGWEKWSLDLAGLATLSDMVPLTGENRIIAYYGLKVLQKTRRPGLLSLASKMKIDLSHITEDDITFMLTPRLNAASRMDSPDRAFELLAETDPVKARVVADHLTKINDQRKTIVATIMRDVHKKLEQRELREVIVIGHPEWRLGVLGLIASKITETYNRPSFVWGFEGAEEGRLIKGSCRSEGSVNVVELMTEVHESFVSFGGHEMAGGFSITDEHIHFLEDKLVSAYNQTKREMNEQTKTYNALILSLSGITKKNYKELARLAPFGLGNEKPLFLFENIIVKQVRQFGKASEHLELIVTDGTAMVKAIAFFKLATDFGEHVRDNAIVSLYATMEMSYFAGKEELRLRIVDIVVSV